jgi:hypothetical protein
VARRIARRHAERERVAAERRRRLRQIAAHLAERGGAGKCPGELEEAAAVDRPRHSALEDVEDVGHRSPPGSGTRVSAHV